MNPLSWAISFSWGPHLVNTSDVLDHDLHICGSSQVCLSELVQINTFVETEVYQFCDTDKTLQKCLKKHLDCPLVNLYERYLKGIECCFDAKSQTSHINSLLDPSQITYLFRVSFLQGREQEMQFWMSHHWFWSGHVWTATEHSDLYFSRSENILKWSKLSGDSPTPQLILLVIQWLVLVVYPKWGVEVFGLAFRGLAWCFQTFLCN